MKGSHLTPYFTCQRKQRHSNRKKADALIKKMKKKRERGSKNLASYKCVHCGGFHIGNSREVVE